MTDFNRRWLPLLIGGVAMLAAACGGDTKQVTIGIASPLPVEGMVEGFKLGLAEAGFVEGENVEFIYEGPVGFEPLEAAADRLIAAASI